MKLKFVPYSSPSLSKRSNYLMLCLGVFSSIFVLSVLGFPGGIPMPGANSDPCAYNTMCGRVTDPKKYETPWSQYGVGSVPYTKGEVKWNYSELVKQMSSIWKMMGGIDPSNCITKSKFMPMFYPMTPGLTPPVPKEEKLGKGSLSGGNVSLELKEMGTYSVGLYCANQKGKMGESPMATIGLSTFPCESGFQGLVDQLMKGNNGLFSQPVNITEDDLKGWFSDDPQDHVGFECGGGLCEIKDKKNWMSASGDKEDLREALTAPYVNSCYGSSFVLPEQSLSGIAQAIEGILKDVQQGYPRAITAGFGGKYESNKFVSEGNHAMIAIGGKDISTKNKPGVRVKVIDTEDATVHTMEFVWTNEVVVDFRKVKVPSGLWGYSSTMGPMFLLVGPSIFNEQALKAAFEGICRYGDAKRYPDLCSRYDRASGKAKITSWLEANYPKMENRGCPSYCGGGICASLSLFVMRVAYLGNFVGECPREKK